MIVNRDHNRESEAAVKVALVGRTLQEFDRKTGQWSASQTLGGNRGKFGRPGISRVAPDCSGEFAGDDDVCIIRRGDILTIIQPQFVG